MSSRAKQEHCSAQQGACPLRARAGKSLSSRKNHGVHFVHTLASIGRARVEICGGDAMGTRAQRWPCNVSIVTLWQSAVCRVSRGKGKVLTAP